MEGEEIPYSPSEPQKKRRFALLLPRFSRYGGVEQFSYRLAVALAQKGHQVDFICARQEVEAPEGVRVISVGRPFLGKAFKLFWFVFRAEQLRRRGRYDLVLSLGKSWKQDVTRMGGGPLSLFWEKSELALPSGLPRLGKRFSRLLSPANWMILGLEQHQFNGESHVIAVSHLVRDWLLQAYSALDPEKVSVIYNKPDLSRFFSPSDEQKREARAWLRDAGKTTAGEPAVFIGTASTNFILKGIAPLLAAVQRLPEQCHLFVAGGRDSKKYVQLAAQLGIADRVHFCGRVDDMPRFYQALDIFILPTFYDACSNAVLEALASGCRTITSRCNGAAVFLPEEQILDTPADVGAMADLLLRQLAAPIPGPFDWPDSMPSGLDAFVADLEKRLDAQAG